ncbi:Uncharacterized protein HZ326_30068 [Fusarium oxysporum f. sp. albedinis]|nr:Uncharacterized protein HZ326_30068 [Fusarium oxysporum f. sp. albedinis]
MQLRIVELLVISIFPVAGLVFYTLSLTGCVSDSPGLPSIFLVAINSSSTAELRIGYFGVCISGNNSHNCVATPYSITPQSLSAALTSYKRRAQSWRFIEQGWSEKTGNALQFVTKRLGAVSLHIKVGYILQVLEWLAFAFSTIFYVVIVKRIARVRNDGLPGGEKLISFPIPPPSRPPGL